MPSSGTKLFQLLQLEKWGMLNNALRSLTGGTWNNRAG